MQPTRLVVLASGMGSRLRSKASPKPLVRLGGISLVERALAGAREAGFDEVVVVTGHRADLIDRHVLEVSRRRGIAVTVVRNGRYREGNGLSALAARVRGGCEPFALVMADHVFSPSLLQRLKQASVEPGEVLVAVDTRLGRAAGVDPGDAMKVRIADGGIRAIGKQLEVYDAFDVGAFVCGPALFDAVEMAAAAGDSSLAGAIGVLAEVGVARALSIGDDEWWFDVDTPRDYRNGSRHILRVTGKPLDGAVAARLNRSLSQRVVTPALLAVFPRITPNQVTLMAFAVAVAAAAGFSVGAPIAAAVLVALASVLDGSDGEVARLTYRSSTYGGFLDAVLDRAADGILFTGAAIYLATDAQVGALLGGAQVPLVLWVSGAALVGHLLVSYTTAKAALDLDHRYRGSLVGGGAAVTCGCFWSAWVPWRQRSSRWPCWWPLPGWACSAPGLSWCASTSPGGRPGPAPRTWACRSSLSISTAPWPTRWASSRTWPSICSSASWASIGPTRPGSTWPRPDRSSRLSWMSSRLASRGWRRWRVASRRKRPDGWGAASCSATSCPRSSASPRPTSRSCCAAAPGWGWSRSSASATGCSTGSRRLTVGAQGTASRCSWYRGSPPPVSPVTRSSSSATPGATRMWPGPQAPGSSAWSGQDTPTPSPAAAPRLSARCPSWPPISSERSAPR